MNKLNKTFKINPLYETDSYKTGHKAMLAPGTTRLYGTWIPRSLKYMPGNVDKIMSVGQQFVVRHLHSTFKENFFDLNKEEALKFTKDISIHIGQNYNGNHFSDLWDLGYLPIEIKSLSEGVFTQPNVPHMTFVNTVNGYAWLTLFLETYISKLAWQLPTVATISHRFRQNANEWVKKTDETNLWLTDFMCHDFHSRGGNPFTSIVAGLGHSFSNKGSDTLNVIPASRYYYDFDEDDVPIYSVLASEHSVSTTKIFTVGEKQMIIDWCKEFPNGILSIVADTFNLWKLITEYLTDPEVKEAILSRNGKLVIRPDSGDPVDIICGIPKERTINWIHNNKDATWEFKGYNELLDGREPIIGKELSISEQKGVIELLWEIFGGTINEQGYKVLDSHIGAIYGDSINLERQVQIYERLSAKGFAATNIVLGIGSYTMVMLTRDSGGYAAKGSWFEVEDELGKKTSYNIYKDPITDSGTKKSLKGLMQVKLVDGEYKVKEECSWEEEQDSELKTIYENGEFFNIVTFNQIRERLI